MGLSWSGVRKILEQDFLCPALQGRVQYFCTHYHSAPDQYGRVCLRVDGKEYAKGNPYSYYVNSYHIMERQLKTEQSILCREWADGRFLYEEENAAAEQVVRQTAIWDGNFDICDFTQALEIYRNAPIGESLASPEPLVRMLAILDRRVGRRTLEKQKDRLAEQPPWLQFFYRLRLEAEGMYCQQDNPPTSSQDSGK